MLLLLRLNLPSTIADASGSKSYSSAKAESPEIFSTTFRLAFSLSLTLSHSLDYGQQDALCLSVVRSIVVPLRNLLQAFGYGGKRSSLSVSTRLQAACIGPVQSGRLSVYKLGCENS